MESFLRTPWIKANLRLAGAFFNEEEENVDDTTTNKVVFVPPPLHAAVAHGSVNAASCLLRMGANPSIRPIVPAPYLSRNYQPSPTRRRSSMEEDRNYKK